MRTAAIVLAAGRSIRMGRDKLTLELGGKTVLQRSVEAFLNADVRNIVIACSETTELEAKHLCRMYGLSVVKGGSSRGQSVYNALKVVDCDIVAIHDAARCFVSERIITDSINCAAMHGSGVAALPVRDTLWKNGETLDRSDIFAAQTPQSFTYGRILAAYEKAVRDGFEATDDCAVYRRMWGEAHFSEGDIANQKLTYSTDMRLFEAMASEIRTGYGEDTHRLTEGRKLILGGAEIPFRLGLLGHSDADALTHAVTDALLGAAALGDIGRMFPDSSEEYRDICSLLLLERAWAKVRNEGYSICSIDAVIVAQEPKLMPYIETMRTNIARSLGCDAERISIKATTPEHTGPEGRIECITARSVCLIKR